MAFVIARRDGRYEIRESVSTPKGPRARTLATFHALSDDVLDHAESRATTRFDRAHIVAKAAAVDVPAEERSTAQVGWDLLVRLGGAHQLPPALAAALAARLTSSPDAAMPDTLPPLLDWLGVGLQERGEALRDLLRLTDRIPSRGERRRRAFPRIASAAR